ncbi:MAG: hypothetical protein COT84_04390 [Chlamydiae bacterium CG10_big_fil_rev_8_21_14_0_10_35_9]|nr:MAG: hypothetical protein COT84_04390 [Chlamydiae bacterium CG10_big_fil_rev_8_21_14_0_10_35_9]
MITVERYTRALQDFSNMDLATSRVTFSREELTLQGVQHWVTVPKIEQKTYKIIQLFQRIFSNIFGKLFNLDSGRLDTARSLDRLTSDTIDLFYGREDLLDDIQLGFDLKNEVTQVALQVLQKIKRVCNTEQGRSSIQQVQTDIRNRFSEARRQTAEDARGDEALRLAIVESQRDSAIAEIAIVRSELSSARADIANLINEVTRLRGEVRVEG